MTGKDNEDEGRQRIDPDEFYAAERGEPSGDWETVSRFTDEGDEYKIQRRVKSDSREKPRDAADDV